MEYTLDAEKSKISKRDRLIDLLTFKINIAEASIKIPVYFFTKHYFLRNKKLLLKSAINNLNLNVQKNCNRNKKFTYPSCRFQKKIQKSADKNIITLKMAGNQPLLHPIR